jgi:hypothetical protein
VLQLSQAARQAGFRLPLRQDESGGEIGTIERHWPPVRLPLKKAVFAAHKNAWSAAFTDAAGPGKSHGADSIRP